MGSESCQSVRYIREEVANAIDCITKLDGMLARGGRGRILTVGEIEHASVSLTK